MIFHPSRFKSALLQKYLEQSFVELTLLPASHREDVQFLALLHAQSLSAYQRECCQRGVAKKLADFSGLYPRHLRLVDDILA
jgi:hypothetical protein